MAETLTLVRRGLGIATYSVLVCLAFPSAGIAQEEGSVRPFLSLARVNPIGPEEFKNFWGWGTAAAVGFGQTLFPDLNSQYSLEYSRFPLDEAAVSRSHLDLGDPIDIEGSAVHLLALRFGIRATPQDLHFWAKPYLLASTGFVWAFDPKLAVSAPAGSEEIRFQPSGINTVHALGAGILIPVPKSRLFLSMDARVLGALSGRSPLRFFSFRAGLSRGDREQ